MPPPSSPPAQWGSQSNLFLMGKHRHKYAHTHAHTHTSNSGSHRIQCSLHPKTEHILGLSLPPCELHTAPQLHIHRARALETHPFQLSLTLAFRVYHQSHTAQPSMGTPTATASHMLVCVHTHTLQSRSHTDFLTQNSHDLTYGYHHMLRTVHLALTHHRTPPETQSAPVTLSLLHPHTCNGKFTDTHSEQLCHAGTSSCLAVLEKSELKPGQPTAGRERKGNFVVP